MPVTFMKGLALLGVSAAVVLMALLPARQLVLPLPAGLAPGVRGVMHIHTRDSDGTGTVDEVAAAASKAGLGFVVTTDHGDATRAASAPSYRSGVLCIDATEVSTFGGHVIALGIPTAPYPLAGEPRDVLDDIHRLGGMAIVAHPHSGKVDLRWTDLTAPFDGIEWLNADSEWRDEQPLALARVLATYGFRGPEALATMLDRTSETLQLWDGLARDRRIVSVPGSDAHARLGDDEVYLRLPSYEALFRTFSLSVSGVTLTGKAETDAAAVIDAIRRGHVYSTIDGLGSPGALQFAATGARNSAVAGDMLESDGGPVTFRVRSSAPDNADVALLRNGTRVAGGKGPSFEYTDAAAAGSYRVEITLAGVSGTPPVPWIVSNPVYVVRPGGPTPPEAPAARRSVISPVYQDGPAVSWAVEKSPRASGEISVVDAVKGSQLLLRYALGGSSREGGFVAFSTPAGRDGGRGVAGYDRVTLTARSNRPMRVWVQLRAPTVNGADRRWRHSIYLDEEARTISIPFSAMKVAGGPPAPTPLDEIDSLLLVVDQVNTKLGSSGQIWIDDVSYER